MVEIKKINRIEKQHYRASKEWKEFREQMKQRQKVCQLCGAPLHGRWNLHHCIDCKTIEEYKSKTTSEFLCLCSECHKYCHWIARKKSTSKYIIKIKQILKAIHFGDSWIKW